MSRLEERIEGKREAYNAAVERALNDPDGLSREPMPNDDDSEEEGEEEEEDEEDEEDHEEQSLPALTGAADPFVDTSRVPAVLSKPDNNPFAGGSRSRAASKTATHDPFSSPKGNRSRAPSMMIDPDDPFGDAISDNDDDGNEPFNTSEPPALNGLFEMVEPKVEPSSLFADQMNPDEDPFATKRPRTPSPTREKSMSILSVDEMLDEPVSPGSPVMALSSSPTMMPQGVFPAMPTIPEPSTSMQAAAPVAATNPFDGSDPKSTGNDKEIIANLKAQMAQQRAEAEEQIATLQRHLSEKRSESRARSQSQLQELASGESQLVAAKETIEHLTKVGRAKDEELVKIKARSKELVVDLQEQLNEKDLELESSQRKVRQLEQQMVEAAEAAETEMLEAVTHYSYQATAGITKKIVVLEQRVLSLQDPSKIHKVMTSFVDAVYPSRGE